MSCDGIPYKLGETAVSGELTHLLGRKKIFDDVDLDSTGAKTLLSGMEIEAVWVKNGSGSTLNAGEACGWDDDYVGQRVDALSAADVMPAGVVDPYVGTVADGEHFWLIRKGPADVIHVGAGTIVKESQLVTNGVAGRVTILDATPADATAAQVAALAVFAKALETPANDNAGTKFRAFIDCRL